MKLYKYAPNNKRLRDLIEKLKSKLTDTEQNKREDIIKALEIIKKLINDENIRTLFKHAMNFSISIQQI